MQLLLLILIPPNGFIPVNGFALRPAAPLRGSTANDAGSQWAGLLASRRPVGRLGRVVVQDVSELTDVEEAQYAYEPPEEVAPAVSLPPLGMSPCAIKVIGVGGGGGNTLNRMVQDAPGGDGRSTFLEFIALNTDTQALSASMADKTFQLGKATARGLGAGGIPAVGRSSAIDTSAEIEELVAGTDMVFVTAGMGGGTGSGAAPVVAELSKACGALTVGIVTRPFSFEGQKRMRQANEAIEVLSDHVDILIVVSNDKLLEIVPDGVPLQEAFCMADEILRQGIVGISDIVVKPGLINVDFADVRSVMQDAGPALMGAPASPTAPESAAPPRPSCRSRATRRHPRPMRPRAATGP